MMRDPITDAAQDPSCLLCLTPDRGGSWWSRLRPAMPRNFADNPMAWTDAKTALDVTDQSHDFTFEIELKCVKTNAVYIFASDGSNDFIRVFMSSGEIIVSTALLSTASGGSTQFSAGSDSTNRHALTVKMIENTITALIDGEIVYTRENLVRNAIEISAPRSNAGYVYKISITDDTTGEIVWQAAYSDLYDTSNPWPSPVPENFAENAKAFYDCQAVVREALDPTHDYKFLFDFEITKDGGEALVFYAGAPNFPFGVYCYSDNTIRVFSNLLRSALDTSSTYVTVAAYSGDTRLQGRHAIELSIEGDTMRVFLDGSEIVHRYKTVRTGTVAVGLPNCNSGYVYRIQITDLTDNQVVWSYPSEAERVRLITKTNVRTDRGAFEAADETQPARVDTALDLRGKVSSYTVVVDFEAAEFPETTTMECHQELAGQGGALIGSGTPPICSIGYYLTSSGSARLQLSQEDAGGRHVVNVTLTGRLSGRHICCGVVEVDPAAPLTASTLYLDGVRIGNASIYAVPTGNAAVNATCFSIAGHSFTGGWASYTGKVYSGLLFDRALSAAEIAALTPKKQPLSWAGIRDVVRRGRAQRYFAVGDVLTVATPRWSIEYEVTGFDQVEPADAALTHSMTLLPVRLVTNLQFDAPEP